MRTILNKILSRKSYAPLAPPLQLPVPASYVPLPARVDDPTTVWDRASRSWVPPVSPIAPAANDEAPADDLFAQYRFWRFVEQRGRGRTAPRDPRTGRFVSTGSKP